MMTSESLVPFGQSGAMPISKWNWECRAVSVERINLYWGRILHRGVFRGWL